MLSSNINSINFCNNSFEDSAFCESMSIEPVAEDLDFFNDNHDDESVLQNLEGQDPPLSSIDSDMCVDYEFLDCDSSTEVCVDVASNLPSSHRIIDPHLFLKLLKSLEHRGGCLGLVETISLGKEVRSGLNLKYYVSCSKCGARTDKAHPVNSSNTNEVAVVGAMAAGLGFIGHKKQYDAINVPTMSERNYRLKSRKVGRDVIKIAKQNMAKAAALEKDLAIQAGSLSPDGTPVITVILDGCFCKRSYGTNYSSLSGGACVIGFKTGLILDAEVLNRYCHTCRLKGENYEHDCSFNYSGPASGTFSSSFID